MMAITKLLAGGAVIAALAGAAPAAAQYYPGYGYGYGGGYASNSQVLVNQCAAAVQQRLSRGYGYGSPYGFGGGRVLGISRIEPRGDGGLRIRGVATSGYGGRPNLTFSCKTDFRGFIRDVDIDPASRSYGYGSPYNPYDYSEYGYRRY